MTAKGTWRLRCLEQNHNLFSSKSMNYKLYVITVGEIACLMNCCIFHLCVLNWSSRKNQKIYMWFRTTWIWHWDDWFFLEVPPYDGVYFIFTVEWNDGGKVHNWSNDTVWTFIYAHALPHSALSQSAPNLHTPPHGNWHPLYFRKAHFPSTFDYNFQKHDY